MSDRYAPKDSHDLRIATQIVAQDGLPVVEWTIGAAGQVVRRLHDMGIDDAGVIYLPREKVGDLRPDGPAGIFLVVTDEILAALVQETSMNVYGSPQSEAVSRVSGQTSDQ